MMQTNQQPVSIIANRVSTPLATDHNDDWCRGSKLHCACATPGESTRKRGGRTRSRSKGHIIPPFSHQHKVPFLYFPCRAEISTAATICGRPMIYPADRGREKRTIVLVRFMWCGLFPTKVTTTFTEAFLSVTGKWTHVGAQIGDIFIHSFSPTFSIKKPPRCETLLNPSQIEHPRNRQVSENEQSARSFSRRQFAESVTASAHFRGIGRQRLRAAGSAAINVAVVGSSACWCIMCLDYLAMLSVHAGYWTATACPPPPAIGPALQVRAVS
ncbi:hypothetical protein J6590_035299 [Homalodisca vitripennis]|nr:hypothetical protein J6590_035299 [Homalodisca vitripennis]